MKRLTLALLALAVGATTVYAQAAPTDHFAWEQAASTLAVAQAYRYDVEMDGVVLATALVTTCTGAASPYTCTAAIPAVTPSSHTARVRAVDTATTTVILGPFSAPLTFTMRATPAQVTGLRIVPGV